MDQPEPARGGARRKKGKREEPSVAYRKTDEAIAISHRAEDSPNEPTNQRLEGDEPSPGMGERPDPL